MSNILKYGLIFLVLLFGLFMFAAGALLPEDFYARITASNKKNPLVADDKIGANTVNATEPIDAAEKNAKENVLDYPTLLLSAYDIESDYAYSLQVGLYLSELNAKQMQTRLSNYEIISEYVLVEDEQKRIWYLLFYGKYQNIDAARTAAYEFLNAHGYKAQIIRFPSQ